MKLAVFGCVLALLAAAALGFSNPKWATTPDGNRYMSPKFSFAAPFQFIAGSAIPHWEYGGHTLVKDEFVRLTQDKQSRAGWVYNVDMCYIHNWMVEVKFRVHGAGTRVYGDGLAVWYRADNPREMTTGPVFGAPDMFKGMGVFLDTFDNNQDRTNPTVQIMLGDGVTPYDPMDGAQTALAECTADFRAVSDIVTLELRYVDAKLTARINMGQGFQDCIEVDNVDLPLGYHWGLSAATGDVADNHDVYSFKVTNVGGLNEMHNGADPERPPSVKGSGVNLAIGGKTGRKIERMNAARANEPESKGSGVSWIVILLIVLIIIGAVIAYVVYALSKDDKKRF